MHFFFIASCSENKLEQKYSGLKVTDKGANYCGITFEGKESDIELFVLRIKNNYEQRTLDDFNNFVLKKMEEMKSADEQLKTALNGKIFDKSKSVVKEYFCIFPDSDKQFSYSVEDDKDLEGRNYPSSIYSVLGAEFRSVSN